MNLMLVLSFFVALGAVGYLLLAVRLFRGKRTVGSLPLALTFLVVGLWVFGGAIEMVAETFVLFSIGRVGHFLGTALVPITTLLCFREFTGRVTTIRAVVALSIVPVLSIIVAATNYWHEFMWYSPATNAAGEFLTRPNAFGFWFKFVHSPYGYLMVATSIATLIMHSSGIAAGQRRSLFVLAGSAIAPVIAIIAYDLGLGPNTISPLPIIFAFMLPMYAWMVVVDSIFDFTPLAYETVFQNMQDPVIVIDDDDRIISLNHGAELMLNMPEADLLREPLQKIFGKDTMEVHVAINSGKPQKMLTESGRFLHVQATPIVTNSAVSANANVLMFRDVSDVEKAQKEVSNSEKLLRTLIDHSVNGIIRMRWVESAGLDNDKKLHCIFANAAAGRYLDIDVESLIGKTVEELLNLASSGMSETERIQVLRQFMESTGRGEGVDTETRVENNGTAKWLRMIGEPVGDDIAITFVDVTDGKAKEKHMESIAISDPLTGVLNRRGFERDATRRLRDSDDDATGAFLFIDLNAFKQINDRYGHEVGDQLLITAAERLRKGLRSCDIIGRPGGDEFVALVPDVRALVAERLAKRLTRSLEQKYLIGERKLSCPASIGLALYPEHASTLTGLLRAADAAMYRAKARSRNVTGIGDSGLLEKAV